MVNESIKTSVNKEVAVCLKGYSFKYAHTEKWVLENADFSLHYGEFVLLSGLSGEGKSTLIASINGMAGHLFLGEQKGEVLVEGERINEHSPSKRAKDIGTIMQNVEAQIIHTRVEDEIAFGCENFGVSPEEIGEQIDFTCKMMGLDKRWFTKTLSGGQKQRLITAAILAMKQKILLFDEPLANLDLEGAKILLKALRDLTQKGYAILIVEHRIDVVIPYVDKVAWIEKGRVHTTHDSEDFFKKAVQKIEYEGKEQSLRQEQKAEADESKKVVFSLKEVGYRVKEREILKNLTFDLYKGERIVILGENGCGKTTLMRMLARLFRQTSGHVDQKIVPIKRNVWGRENNKGTYEWFQKVGYVYQNPHYQLFMPTVYEEVKYQAKNEEACTQMLDIFNLQSLKERHPHSLSEGQKRRVTLAAVCAAMPEVLLLDEPTVGQDYKGLKKMVQNINELHKKTGNTVVTITHDVRCIEALADRILWMHKGQVYKIGGKELIEEYFSFNK
jgi:energy-coupling factor transport system ATP-binding protein